MRNRVALHQAALTLAEKHGLEFTIDDVAGTAGVSRRTFFNHFATKLDAILNCGLNDSHVCYQEAFLAGDFAREGRNVVEELLMMDQELDKQRCLGNGIGWSTRIHDLVLREEKLRQHLWKTIQAERASRIRLVRARYPELDEDTAWLAVRLAESIILFSLENPGPNQDTTHTLLPRPERQRFFYETCTALLQPRAQ
ncbi:TetR family transcriptional regulator [Corynebacterium poyangense]|uniref:TetR family transcriptional regulator n=1 Tax=Corynebacterium poyangense TaxID=2684405 RepID=A0A7H0SS67_9CORY|nr:TetR family transcriptional regulator [Corynebacterium poyangense]QNQ91392.1 TetR family transcriptional regulator [Corynebacterium poyangense]